METADEAEGVGGKRRYRTVEEKLRIVEETLAAETLVAVVARRHGVNANQLFHWRKLYQSGLLVPPRGESVSDESRLLPVTVADDAASEQEAASVAPPSGAIHIEFPGRALVSVESSVDVALGRAVLESLKR